MPADSAIRAKVVFMSLLFSVILCDEVSKIIEAGGVAAAVESISGNIYVGVCVDTACTLGVCAERNAMFHMITNGENAIKRVIAIDREGKAIPPCGACRDRIISGATGTDFSVPGFFRLYLINASQQHTSG